MYRKLAGILPYFKNFLCKITENTQADEVLRRQTVVFRGDHKHIVENQSRLPIFQYHIDGDIISNTNGERCDFIVEVQKEQPMAFIIELKGSDLNKAISQIEATITRFPQLKDYSLLPRIIIHKGRTHSVNDGIKRKFIKKYPKSVIKERVWEDALDDII